MTADALLAFVIGLALSRATFALIELVYARITCRRCSHCRQLVSLYVNGRTRADGTRETFPAVCPDCYPKVFPYPGEQ